MADPYKQFDKDPIVDTSDVVIKGFRFRVRELALGIVALVCLLVIIILAALLASAKSGSTVINDADASASASVGGCTDSCFTPACLKTAAHVTELINFTADACDDFHTFACTNFARLHPLEPDEGELTTSWLIYNKNQDRLHRLLDRPLVDPNSNHYETKMKWFFASCQDHFLKMKQQGRPFVEKVLKPTGWWALDGDSQWAAQDYDFQRHLEKVHVDYWTDAFFRFSITEDMLDWNKPTIQIGLAGIGTPWTSYKSIFGDKRSPPGRGLEDYKKYIRTVTNLLLRDAELNITAEEKAYRVETVLNDTILVEKQLAMIKEFAEVTADPTAIESRLSLTQLKDQSQGAIDWVQFFTYMFDQAPVTASTKVVVLEKDYVVKFQDWIRDLDPANKSRILNNYLSWRLAQSYTQDLSWDYIHATREMYVDLVGVAEFLGTWRYCVNKIDRDMKEGLGALFVRDHFADENKKTAHEITDYVKTALVESLNSALHWMSPETRHIAILKINESLIKLGYPDWMMNDGNLNQIYSVLSIKKEDYFGNLLSFNKYFKHYLNDRLTNFHDKTVWVYATYTFVAQYWNPWKELIVPAGLLQFPIYDHTSPRYMNFGSMGSIVGRQLTHAIDEIGNFYSLNGSHYGTWWSSQTNASYERVRQCIVDAYKNLTMGPFVIPPAQKGGQPVTIAAQPVNAEYLAPLTLGESSGVRLAYKAYKDWTGVTGGEKSMPGHLYSNDQMFFISYAQTFCYNRNPLESFYKALRGSSLPENIRVNSALAQLQEFQDAFKCNATSKMVAPKRCSLY